MPRSPLVQSYSMPARVYVEALLTDECAANAVWELWNAGILTNGSGNPVAPSCAKIG